ncbi:uncharacterized protein LOC130967058 [Arachis stenosperma]|uniref:uncharacterized protein LOC130967058 n=1 Tax=Arachis stenosperma TaxID=217475 RepID=UPI0025AC0229|nr:uncharacterized protein LOC130967058 [Arachis stenosperma]
MVRDYGETLLKCNPESTVRIGTIPQPDGNVIFQRMYVCLSGCKNGFKAGCRRLIGLDGAFLKTQTGGQILSAVGQDANHHIYVIAWAIVDVENTENWRWFLELLHEDLGDYKENKWCFMSDMQKGLLSAVQEVMPHVHHRFCVWHLWRNFNKQWKDLELRGLLWECARSTTYQDFSDNMKKIKKINEDAWNYLNKWPMESWTKSAFSHAPKLDNICNNACEVFNARIKEARAKPIITLLEEVRMFVLRTIAKNKVKLAKHVGKLPPVVQSRLDKIRKESKSWMPIWTGDDEYEKFEVHGHPTNMVVDLGKRLCTCQFWMLTGMPCVHACAALARVNKRPEDFCHKWLTMDAYRDTYAHYINPLPGQSLWEKSDQNRPQAPKKKKKPGPVTKKRRKDADEGNEGSKKSKVTGTLKRQLKPFTCKYCLQKGHTKRGCPKKRAADITQALADAAAAAAKTKPTEQAHTEAPPDAPAPAPPEAPSQAAPEAPAQPPAPVEIDLSQQNYSDAQQSQHSQEDPPARPSKLQTRRRSSTPPSGSITVDPLQGASSATSSRLANFLKFVPTPGFKPPRKKK